MGKDTAIRPAEALVQLLLRSEREEALIDSDEDWRVLESIAARMLFWSGSVVYACRCEGNEMRFALKVQRASLGTVAHQLAGSYATHLRKTRHINGRIFKHYLAAPLRGDSSLEDLVFWLHRSREPLSDRATEGVRVWTADRAYLLPGSMPWIDTRRVLGALGLGAAGAAAYRRRRMQPISPRIIELCTLRPQRIAARAQHASHLSIEGISRRVAVYSQVAYEAMIGDTRKRTVSRARVIATVLATRNGITAAAAARHFNRSRSALIEQVEHYRAAEPEIFSEAQSRLEACLAGARE